MILYFTLLFQYCILLLLRILVELSYMSLDDVHVCLVLKMLALSIIPMLNSSPIDENPQRFASTTDPQRSARICQHELQCKSQAKISKRPLRSRSSTLEDETADRIGSQ